MKFYLIRLNNLKPKHIILILIDFYRRFISPIFPYSCRFYPTCSSYARLAIDKHGIWRGGILALMRIFKCHPLHPGGYDPVK